MASEKRERQRANRELRRAERAKEERKRQAIAIIKRYATFALVFGAILVAFTVLFGK